MADVLALLQEGLSSVKSGNIPDASFLKALMSKVKLSVVDLTAISAIQLDAQQAAWLAGPGLCDRSRSVTAESAADTWHTELRQCGRPQYGFC